MNQLDLIRQKAIKETDVHLILPEGRDARIPAAASRIAGEGIARVTVLGRPEEIEAACNEAGVEISDFNTIDPEKDMEFEKYVDIYTELRKKKGMTAEKARKIMADPTFFGAMMLRTDRGDICISGALNPTAHVLRAGLQIVRTAAGVSVMSSDMLMFSPDDRPPMSFADCAVNPDPNSEQLAEIAYSTAQTHKAVFGVEPVTAMLSFSTAGSAKHKLAEKVIEAVRIAKEKYDGFLVDGEMQADAAIVEKVGRKKAPNSPVAGRANVLIFPDLGAGNISYKLVQRFAGYQAVGPILQGLRKPIHDLSRGCSSDDIVNLTAVAALQTASK